jgi:hypothetical protein
MKALSRLYQGFIKALSGLYQGFIKALSRLSIKALSRRYLASVSALLRAAQSRHACKKASRCLCDSPGTHIYEYQHTCM